MLKTFLVEDEVVIREMIKKMIPWEQYGFELAGEASDGEMALPTAETKFIPKEAVPITLGEDQQVKIRLIDSVGFLVKGASGQTEDGKERMVKTPWFEQAIPFREAARIGTQKVIQEHSTIGIESGSVT